MSALGVVAAVAVGLVLAGCATGVDGPAVTATSMLSSSRPAEPTARDRSSDAPLRRDLSGPVVDNAELSCVEDYSPAAVADRAFALDGTVVAVGEPVTDRRGKGELNYMGVTFAVAHWFTGGPAGTVTIDVAPPRDGASVEAGPPAYAVGSRLLVAGESRWGEGVMRDALAWGCGFTRYYDAQTAAQWRDATRQTLKR